MISARTSNSTSKGGRGVLKRAMTLPVDQDDPTPSANSRQTLYSYSQIWPPLATSFLTLWVEEVTLMTAMQNDNNSTPPLWRDLVKNFNLKGGT